MDKSSLFQLSNSVRLIGYYGSDLLIAEQAWMSTGKNSMNPEAIQSVLNTLVRRKHLKPLEVVHLHFEVTTSIAIDRQICTYRSLSASVAQSGRYGSIQTEFFVPSNCMDAEERNAYTQAIADAAEVADSLFNVLATRMSATRAREISRNILPQGQMTRRRFCLNLRSLLHLLDERLAPSAQEEIRDVAQQMIQTVAPHFPFAMDAVKKHYGSEVITQMLVACS